VVRDLSYNIESEKMLLGFLESATNGFSIVDADLRLLYINDARVELSVLSREELLGKTVPELYSDYEESGRAAVYQRVLDTGNPESYPDVFKSRDGETVNVIINIFKIGDNIGISTLDVTQRVNAEEAVRESEERGRIFRESAVDSISLLDRAMNIVEVNTSWLENTRYSKEEVIGRHILDVLPALDMDRFKVFKQVMETGTPAHFYAVNAASGSGNVIDVSAFRAGDFLGIISRNISEQIEYQRRLEVLHNNAATMSSAETMEEITDIMVDSINRITSYDIITLGIVKEESLVFDHRWNKQFSDTIILPLDGLGLTVQAVQMGHSIKVSDLRENGHYIKFIEEEKSLSELVVPVIVSGNVVAVINIESNNVDAFSENDQSLLEILASHVSAAMSRIGYNERLNALHVITIELNYAHTLEKVVQTTFRIMRDVMGLRFSSFQLIENEHLVTIDTDGNPSMGMRLPLNGRGITTKAAREGKTLIIGDLRNEPNFIKGSTNSLSELAVPIKTLNETIGVLNVESLQLNAYTQNDARLMEILAQNVGSAISRLESDERRNNLESELLLERVRTEQEQELNRLKTRFMSTATHEIRTPMTSIQGYIEILEDIVGDLSEEQLQYFNVIRRNVQRLSVLTNDLLDLQRLEEGRIFIIPEIVDINTMLDDVVNEFTPILAEKDQTLRINRDDLTVRMDKLRVMQVIINLLSNASKFSPVGSEILLDVKKEGENARFSVSDQGTGLSQEDVGKLFTPFPDILVDGNAGGTGLGLSICKGIIELHEGKIWAESRGKEQGSVFSFTLPL
ncbi:MAG: GAF domain-containing protein, partial [Candidatus Thorarchaeota archaeon]